MRQNPCFCGAPESLLLRCAGINVSAVRQNQCFVVHQNPCFRGAPESTFLRCTYNTGPGPCNIGPGPSHGKAMANTSFWRGSGQSAFGGKPSQKMYPGIFGMLYAFSPFDIAAGAFFSAKKAFLEISYSPSSPRGPHQLPQAPIAPPGPPRAHPEAGIISDFFRNYPGIVAGRWHQLRLGTSLPHAPRVRMT